MFCARYFARRYFPARYWPKVGSGIGVGSQGITFEDIYCQPQVLPETVSSAWTISFENVTGAAQVRFERIYSEPPP